MQFGIRQDYHIPYSTIWQGFKTLALRLINLIKSPCPDRQEGIKIQKKKIGRLIRYDGKT
jgi:hypothetical protein